MMKVLAALICCLAASSWAAAGPDGGKNDQDLAQALVQEQTHFLECLAYVYQPGMWVSYNDGLYFTAMSAEQAKTLEQMKATRSQYIALTDRQKRHQIAAKGIVSSGVDQKWVAKLLLPYSETNQNLTPTLNRVVRILPAYKLLQNLGNGDALIQGGDGTVSFVMNFGRAADDAGCTNGLFIREGEKTYRTQSDGQNTVEALTSVGLNSAERAALQKVSAQFQRQAAQQKPVVIAAADREEFDLLKARATDSNPYLQFLVAKAYLDGKGTPKDEKNGLEWMRRAGANGSGDAKTYLETHSEPK